MHVHAIDTRLTFLLCLVPIVHACANYLKDRLALLTIFIPIVAVATFSSAIRGFHVFRHSWAPHIGQQLQMERTRQCRRPLHTCCSKGGRRWITMCSWSHSKGAELCTVWFLGPWRRHQLWSERSTTVITTFTRRPRDSLLCDPSWKEETGSKDPDTCN